MSTFLLTPLTPGQVYLLLALIAIPGLGMVVLIARWLVEPDYIAYNATHPFFSLMEPTLHSQPTPEQIQRAFEVAAPYLPYGVYMQTPVPISFPQRLEVIGWAQGEWLFEGDLRHTSISFAIGACKPVLHHFNWLATGEGRTVCLVPLLQEYLFDLDEKTLKVHFNHVGNLLGSVWCGGAAARREYWFELKHQDGLLTYGAHNRSALGKLTASWPSTQYAGLFFYQAHVALGLDMDEYVEC